MNILDLKFKPVTSSRESVSSAARNSRIIKVTKTINHGEECTSIRISAPVMRSAGFRVGDRLMAGVVDTDKGVAVKLWIDQLSGYKLSPSDTTVKASEHAGKSIQAHLKSKHFNSIPAGDIKGASIHAKDGEVYFLCK